MLPNPNHGAQALHALALICAAEPHFAALAERITDRHARKDFETGLQVADAVLVDAGFRGPSLAGQVAVLDRMDEDGLRRLRHDLRNRLTLLNLLELVEDELDARGVNYGSRLRISNEPCAAAETVPPRLVGVA